MGFGDVGVSRRIEVNEFRPPYQEGDDLLGTVLLDFIAKGHASAVVGANVNEHHVVAIAMPYGTSFCQVAGADHVDSMKRHDFLAQRAPLGVGVDQENAELGARS